MEYIVATLSGHMENVHINIHNNAVAIASDEMKQPNGHSKYALYGVATSLNNAFLLGSYFAGRVSIQMIHFLDLCLFFFSLHFISVISRYLAVEMTRWFRID